MNYKIYFKSKAFASIVESYSASEVNAYEKNLDVDSCSVEEFVEVMNSIELTGDFEYDSYQVETGNSVITINSNMTIIQIIESFKDVSNVSPQLRDSEELLESFRLDIVGALSINASVGPESFFNHLMDRIVKFYIQPQEGDVISLILVEGENGYLCQTIKIS